tara:strand:- start:410 stop:562 length:153 start_codon:yes stop_codon:yes gene_type:complete
MLFSFNIFWKFIGTIVGFWILYGALGYEFTVVTLLSLIVAQNFKKDEKED